MSHHRLIPSWSDPRILICQDCGITGYAAAVRAIHEPETGVPVDGPAVLGWLHDELKILIPRNPAGPSAWGSLTNRAMECLNLILAEADGRELLLPQGGLAGVDPDLASWGKSSVNGIDLLIEEYGTPVRLRFRMADEADPYVVTLARSL